MESCSDHWLRLAWGKGKIAKTICVLFKINGYGLLGKGTQKALINVGPQFVRRNRTLIIRRTLNYPQEWSSNSRKI